jgi:hypothetical protein
VAAISVIAETYERGTLEFLRVTKRAGEARFTFEPYDRPSTPALTPSQQIGVQ